MADKPTRSGLYRVGTVDNLSTGVAASVGTTGGGVAGTVALIVFLVFFLVVLGFIVVGAISTFTDVGFPGGPGPFDE